MKLPADQYYCVYFCTLEEPAIVKPSELEILITGMITFRHSIGKKIKHRHQSFTRIGRQFQSLKRQFNADWTSISFPLCQRSCRIWRTMTNTYVVIFLSASIFGRGYHSRYQNFKLTGQTTLIFVKIRQYSSAYIQAGRPWVRGCRQSFMSMFEMRKNLTFSPRER